MVARTNGIEKMKKLRHCQFMYKACHFTQSGDG